MLATDSAMQARLGEAGRKRVEMYFDWDRKIDKILDIYRFGITECIT
jgi:glycosyltransferase involved in cell wall biosynthesis